MTQLLNRQTYALYRLGLGAITAEQIIHMDWNGKQIETMNIRQARSALGLLVQRGLALYSRESGYEITSKGLSLLQAQGLIARPGKRSAKDLLKGLKDD